MTHYKINLGPLYTPALYIRPQKTAFLTGQQVAYSFLYAEGLRSNLTGHGLEHALEDMSERLRYRSFLDNETVKEIFLITTVNYPTYGRSDWQFWSRTSPANGIGFTIRIVSVVGSSQSHNSRN